MVVVKDKKINSMPKVSVAVISYNQEKYIRKAVESILAQNTVFDVQIVIGDDCSTDGTQQILLELDRAYPGRLQLVFNSKNLGISENAYNVRRLCKGEYLALLDGDNYWLDDDKLQRQVDFLDRHPEYIGCAHDIEVVDKNGKPYLGPYYALHKKGKVCTLKDIEQGYLPGQIGTWVFKNIFKDMTEVQLAAYRNCNSVGDSKLAMVLALYGDIYIYDQKMSALRMITDETSFSSHSYNSNLSLDYLDWLEARERLAKEAFSRTVDYRIMRYDIFYHSVVLVVKRFDRANWQIYLKVRKRLKQLKFKHLYVLKRGLVRAFEILVKRGCCE